MNENEKFMQEMQKLGINEIPKGITLLGDKKQELLDFINNNSRGGHVISEDGKLQLAEGELTLLDEMLEKVIEENKNLVITLEDLSNVEKDAPVVTYINENEDSRIIVIDETYFEENKKIVKEYDGKTYEIFEFAALVHYIAKGIGKSNKPKIVPLGRDEINGTATSATNVYAGPSSSTYASIGSISNNEGVVVIGESLGWYHIRYFITGSNQEKMGYVPKSLIDTSVSTSEEDFYGEFAYAKNALQIRSTQNFNDSVSNFGSLSQYEGMTLLYSYDYFGDRISFVEYSTATGTKRGYVYESEIEKPLSNKSCVARLYAKTSVYAGTNFNIYSDIGVIGTNELVAILAKEDNRLYVEYNTTGGRKRGYITTSGIIYYHRPEGFPDFYSTTHASQRNENAWITTRQTVYGGPNTTYADIGVVNNENIINYSTNSGSNEPLTYIEYWITNSSTKKSGYIATNDIITIDPGEQPAEKTLTTITKSYRKFSERKSYGQTQLGREMYYYKAGSGAKHLFLIFAQHGWEDGLKANGHYFAGDGDALIRIGQNFMDRFDNESNEITSKILSDWTIYIFPGINLDGIEEGVGVGFSEPELGDNGSFGRCFYNGLDPNRNWAGDFKVYNTIRNKTGSIPFQAVELKNLRDCLRENRSTTGKNVLLDIHGWLNTTYGDISVAEYYISGMGLGDNTTKEDSYGAGYLMNWARNSSNGSTNENDSNQAGIGASAVSLVELKPTRDYSVKKIENDYGLKFYNSTMNLLKKFN